MASTLLREQVALRKLIWVGPLTIVSTVIANLIIRTIAVSSFGVPETFQYVEAPYVIGSTIVFVLVALLVFCWLIALHDAQSSSIVYWRALSCASRFSVPLWPWLVCSLLLA